MTIRPTLAALTTLGLMSLAIHDTMAAPKIVIIDVDLATSTHPKDTPRLVASRQIVPPPEYDRPYTGKLTITRVATEAEVSARCPASTWPYKHACAQPYYPLLAHGYASCHIVLIQDSAIRAAGFTPELYMRHEQAHCNGWPPDHKGARFAP